MFRWLNLKNIISNDKAVSEEFTSLPALSIVMIGFTVFFLLLANTYNAYEYRLEILERYKTADFIASKLTNPDCFFIKEGRIVDINLLKKDESKEKLNAVRDEYKQAGFDFIIRISYDEFQKDFPEDLPATIGDSRAVSKSIGVYINEAQTKAGKLTVILWSVFY
jgi:hypothetical protein